MRTLLGICVVLLVGACLWFLILPEYEKLGQMDQQLSRLEADLIQKQRIANNLPKFKAEFLKLEEQVKEALTELPGHQHRIRPRAGQCQGYSPADTPHHWDELPYLAYARILLAQNRLRPLPHLVANGDKGQRPAQIQQARQIGRQHGTLKDEVGQRGAHPILGDSTHGDTRVNRWWREEHGLTRLGLHCLTGIACQGKQAALFCRKRGVGAMAVEKVHPLLPRQARHLFPGIGHQGRQLEQAIDLADQRVEAP